MCPDVDRGRPAPPVWKWSAHLQHYQELQTVPRVGAECPRTSRDSHPEEVSHRVMMFDVRCCHFSSHTRRRVINVSRYRLPEQLYSGRED